MCGIFGYIGSNKAPEIALKGLKKLEYRGYDSAGIAGITDGKVVYSKEAGKISSLEKELEKKPLETSLAIAQTRWATHGIPSKINAHPHLDSKATLAVVHNGIIENYEALKKSLKDEGVSFVSDTDTEVVAHLIAKFYQGDLLQAVQSVLPLLKGAFALAIIHRDHPDEIIGIGHEAPLVIGLANNETYLSSDPHALAEYTKEVVYLSHGEVAVLKRDKLEIYDSSSNKIDKKSEQLKIRAEDTSKGSFEHYTLKEIFEQPMTLRAATQGRFDEDYGTALFDTLEFDVAELLLVKRVLLLGCGTSLHSALVGSYLFEEISRIPAQIEISSEFRYKNPIVSSDTLVIAISQSGETADTIAAVRELKAKGAKILSVCNVMGSTLARESDGALFLHAGPEIGVCSTKAYTSQVAVLALFVLMMARMRHMTKQEGHEFLAALKELPKQAEDVLKLAPKIEAIAKKYAKFDNFFFIGRNYMFPTSLEGALKLKEISYINANGYPAGELKHGPIALINENTPIVAFTNNKATFEKMMSNIQEVKARAGKVIAISDESSEIKGADEVISIPSTNDALATILSTIVSQLFAYYVAKERGCDIDQPRNLAKSVTVE